MFSCGAAVPHMITFGLQSNAEKQLDFDSRGDILDDPMPERHIEGSEGLLAFSGDPGKGANSRSTILMLTLEKKHLMANRKTPWEVPVGKLVKGMDVLRGVYQGYGDEPQFGLLNPANTHCSLKTLANNPGKTCRPRNVPDAATYWAQFPKLDRFLSCNVVRDKLPTTDPMYDRQKKDEL